MTALRKRTVRKQAARAVTLGPCAVCGSRDRVHRHHDDWTKPLEVTMLCQRHHTEREMELGRWGRGCKPQSAIERVWGKGIDNGKRRIRNATSTV